MLRDKPTSALLGGLSFCLAMALAPVQAGDQHHQHQDAGAAGDDPHAHHRAMMSKPASDARGTEVELRDLNLIDQEGRSVRFASDVVADRIVVMDFVYTTCTTVCPVLSAVFGQLQTRLGARLGEDVFLVSLSVDPARDTPQRLKAYSAKHGAREGWLWLTGQKPLVDDVLQGLGAYAPNFEDHPAMVLVGDGRSGDWTRFFGFPSPDQIMAKVDELATARQSDVGG